jgi:hypothetical protein
MKQSVEMPKPNYLCLSNLALELCKLDKTRRCQRLKVYLRKFWKSLVSKRLGLLNERYETDSEFMMVGVLGIAVVPKHLESWNPFSTS